MSQIFVAHLLLTIIVAHASAGIIHKVCAPNSELRQCGSLCEPTCTNPAKRFCKPAHPEACKQECRCFDGWVRNKDTNECVELSECSGLPGTPRITNKNSAPEPNCPPNETLSLCGTLCEPTCANKKPNKLLCPRIVCTKITQRCRCNSGYYRDTESRECLLSEDCPVVSNGNIPEVGFSNLHRRIFGPALRSFLL